VLIGQEACRAIICRPLCPIRKKRSSERRGINVRDDFIAEEDNQRILGLTVNNTLTWSDHVLGKGGLLNAVHQRTGALRRISHQVPKKSLPTIASAIVASKIRYGIAIYGGARIRESDPTSELNRSLQIGLNRAMRVATKCRVCDHVAIADLVDRTGIQSVNRMSAEDKLRLVWNSVKDNGSPLADVFHPLSCEAAGRSSRSILRGDLQSRAKTTLSQKNFPEPAIRLWNASTASVHESTSKYTSKKAIRAFVNTIPL